MSFSETPPTILNYKEDVVHVAEALSAILVSKLNSALRDAIAMEAERCRSEVLHILTELRKDIQCRFEDFDIKHSNDPPISPPDDTPRHASVLSENLSNTSSLSLPLASFHRATSLEQRLAAGIFTAKYAKRKGSKEPKANAQREQNLSKRDNYPRQPSANCHNEQQEIMFDPAVPIEPAENDRLPGEVPVDDCKETPTRQTRQSSERIHPSASSASSSTNGDTTSQANFLNVPKSTLARVSSLDSKETDASGRNMSPEDSTAAVASGSRRSTSITSSCKGVTRWKQEAKRFYDERSPSASEAMGLARRIIANVFKALGIMPWSDRWVMLSRLYQFAILCCLIMSTLNILMRPFIGYLHEKTESAFAVHVDDVLALGAFLCFSAAVWKNDALHDSSWLIESYLSRAGRLEDTNKESRLQLAIMLLTWSLCVGPRLYAHVLTLSLIDLSFAFNIMVLLALCLYLHRICHCLSVIVDDFCCYMQDNTDFEQAVEEFFLVHCTVRTACASLQYCFVILQLTSTVLLLFGSAAIYFDAMSNTGALVQLLPGLLCQITLLQLSVRASLVSDKCARIPMLVNAADAKLSMERMYVVEYIFHCQTGFYIFEVRLNTATLLKLYYVAFIGWCGLLTRGLVMHARMF